VEKVAADFREEWVAHEKELGPFQRFEPLGTGPLAGGRVVTWVRLVFARGSRTLTNVWRGPVVALVQAVKEPTGPVFLPVGPRELAAYDPRSGAVSRVRFETEEGGAAALVLGEAKARKK
jgi:hypothetical protein